MYQSLFYISEMDCPAEENMLRMKFAEKAGVHQLECDLSTRQCRIFHTAPLAEIEAAVDALHLGATLLKSEEYEPQEQPQEPERNAAQQKQLLLTVLLINAAFFLIEAVAGMVGESMGLLADGLDMLADALVYGMALWAVGGSVRRQKNIARYSAYLQFSLAFLGVLEVLRRFFTWDGVPNISLMIGVSVFALLGNATCLWLLNRQKSEQAHMRASQIFTANDVIINLGVILAAILVQLTQQAYADLIIGLIIYAIVFRGAFRILALSKP